MNALKLIHLRAWENIKELNSDNNNVAILKHFLDKVKVAYKKDSRIAIDESKLIELYENAVKKFYKQHNARFICLNASALKGRDIFKYM